MTDNLDELRHIEGFPVGNDEAINALSDSPSYTAYPNPHIDEFLKKYGTSYDESTDNYHREPYSGDISAKEQNPVYAAHAYHTKVPPEIITTLLKHYSRPGDVVLDVFCGTGMTGVACRELNRNCLLIDLSPIATFVSHVNTTSFSIQSTLHVLDQIIKETERELGYLYETQDKTGRKGVINYTVWSDVYTCPYCDFEFPFFPSGVEHLHGKVRTLDSFPCPKCNADLNIRSVRRVITSDNTKKKELVWINAKVNKVIQDREPSKFDLEIAQKAESSILPYWYPTDKVDPDWYSARLGQLGQKRINSVDKFLSKRNLWIYSALFSKISRVSDKKIRSLGIYILTGLFTVISERQGYFGGGGGMSGNLYMPVIRKEQNIFHCLQRRLSKVKSAEVYKQQHSSCVYVGTQSATDLRKIPDSSIDYIYIDPPFGANIIYSEMNSILESWLSVRTNDIPEAVINEFQEKGIEDYHDLIFKSFAELYRVIKPGRWITVEFHNTQASIWNMIQECLAKAGFIVAQTGTLDKGSSTILQDIRAGAVNNDIIISALKPKVTVARKLAENLGQGFESEYIKEYLKQLPLTCLFERSQEMLYSRYLAFYIKHGYQILYNGDQFYKALTQWGFEERDGYWFADEIQVNDYEKRKVKSFEKGGFQTQAVLFVIDERSARQWIWNFLDEPKSYDSIYTNFVQVLQSTTDEIPEVKVILEESFVRTNGYWKRPDQLTQAELEKKRHERLLRQFEEYLNTARANQKLKEVRLEAVIAGFTECYRSGRYNDILTVGHKLDKSLLENSTDLYDFIDIAEAKVE
ncbi:MAG: hypothetical protein CVU39_07760 [Chloroflexi bacterium HGW-Chloroflexi-10]|nr:MAG: hypothetical protein CVU39_07760 [Chloroflexi bacterium HGW-Chloroflexi-10]